MAITRTESPTATKQARTKRVLQHIELHPKFGGGHIVKHVHEPPYVEGESTAKEYHFNEHGKAPGGEHIYDHLKKHAGLPEASKATEENDPEEMGEGEQDAKP